MGDFASLSTKVADFYLLLLLSLLLLLYNCASNLLLLIIKAVLHFNISNTFFYFLLFLKLKFLFKIFLISLYAPSFYFTPPPSSVAPFASSLPVSQAHASNNYFGEYFRACVLVLVYIRSRNSIIFFSCPHWVNPLIANPTNIATHSSLIFLRPSHLKWTPPSGKRRRRRRRQEARQEKKTWRIAKYPRFLDSQPKLRAAWLLPLAHDNLWISFSPGESFY